MNEQGRFFRIFVTGYIRELRYISLLFLLFISTLPSFAQPANDNWDKAIPLSEPSKCSSDGAYTTINATDEGIFGTAPQWPAGQSGRDVWFKFTAIAYDVNITVTGASTGGGSTGGTLQNPLISLYTIESTANSISFSAQVGSLATTGTGITTYYKGALTVGKTYYIRVSARNNAIGTFQLCINNYFAPLKAGQDVATASILCDKKSFTESNVSGSGTNNREAAGSCLLNESNSVWYEWTAANNGTLTMDITPTVNTDDIDWVLYDLGPSGSFSNKTLLRCAVGHGVSNTGCPNDPLYFKTGMNLTSTDITEEAGCGGGGQDGYLRFIDMQQGHTYVLLVDNFSNGNNGFKLEFGGTGEFVGPEAKIVLTKNQPCSPNQSFTFNNTGSKNYKTVEWNFGEGASIATANTVGPHTVTYSSPGFKTAVLQVFNEEGCAVSITESFLVGLKPALPQISGLKPRYCIGETIELSTPIIDGATYSWIGPGGFTSNTAEIKVPVDGAGKAGIYSVTVTLNDCSSDPASVTIAAIGQTPTASFLITNNNPCTVGQSFTFTNSSKDFQKIRWDFGAGSSIPPGGSNPVNTVTYSSSGTRTIRLEAEGSSGCISVFTQEIIVALSPTKPEIIVNKPDFCLTDVIRLSTTAQTDVIYKWTGPNNFSSNLQSPEIPVTSEAVAGTYSLTLSRGNCTTETVSIVVPPIYKNPVAAFRSEPKAPVKLSFPIRVRFFNESKDADAFLWDFGDGNTSTDKDPEHTYLSAGDFDVTLTVFKSSVCSASVAQGKFMISANNILFIPNTFTPNNDTLNDEFVISMTNIKTYRIQIFNRFGVSMFISDDLFKHWKGTFNNEPLPVGTYYYLIDAVDFNGNIIKKTGHVTIIR
jgi:gliding motility-associated-like protein